MIPMNCMYINYVVTCTSPPNSPSLYKRKKMHIIYKILWFVPVDIVGKRVLITGTTSGIGKQLALTYAKMGASVFMTARKEDILKEVCER